MFTSALETSSSPHLRSDKGRMVIKGQAWIRVEGSRDAPGSPNTTRKRKQSGCHMPHKEVSGWQPVHLVWVPSPPPHTASLDRVPQGWEPNLTAGLPHLPEFQRDAITPEETCLVSLAPNRTRRWKITLLGLRAELSWGRGDCLPALRASLSPKAQQGMYSQGWEPSGPHWFLFPR